MTSLSLARIRFETVMRPTHNRPAQPPGTQRTLATA